MTKLTENAAAEGITALVNRFLSLQPFTGTIFAAVDGKVVFNHAYGMACYAFSVPNTTTTRFSMASVSKQFTTFAIMMLHEKGLLDIDKPANLYLPECFRISGHVLVRHLMNHTSGLYVIDYYKDDFYFRGNMPGYARDSFFNEYLKDRPLTAQPGEKYEYSNTGFNMLAWIVEHVSGKSFPDFLREQITKPLGMNNTFVDTSVDIVHNHALPYTYYRDTIVRSPFFNMKYSTGAGGLISNSEDMHRWFQCLKDRALISGKAYDRYLHTGVAGGYCFGLAKDTKDGRTRFAHAGGHHGIATYCIHCLEDDAFILVLSNNDHSCVNSIANKIAELIFTGSADVPAKPAEVAVDETLARRYEGVYFDRRIAIERHNGEWELSLRNGDYRSSIYPIGNHQFAYRYKEGDLVALTECPDGVFAFSGLRKRYARDGSGGI